MTYRWKRGLKNAARIFLGVIVFKLGSNKEHAIELMSQVLFWKHTLWNALCITSMAEMGYILSWLSIDDNGGNNGTENKQIT